MFVAVFDRINRFGVERMVYGLISDTRMRIPR